eukprot:s1489_g19.t1
MAAIVESVADAEKVMAVLPHFKYSEALAQEETVQEIRCQLTGLSAQTTEAKATIQTDMDAARQHLQQAEAALEQVKESERQGVSQLEAKVNTLVEAQLQLQAAEDEKKKVEKENHDEILMGEELREAKSKNIAINEDAFCCLLNGSWTSAEERKEKLATLKEYLQEIGTEKTLVAAADGLITKPEVRGDFDKLAIDCITEELIAKLKQVEEKLAERAPAEREVRAEVMGLEALVDICRQKATAAEEQHKQVEVAVKGSKTEIKTCKQQAGGSEVAVRCAPRRHLVLQSLSAGGILKRLSFITAAMAFRHLDRKWGIHLRVLATMLLAAIWSSHADMYLNSPRGSNNKLREQSNNVQNANRLFDSQNNAASGYQIGDDCKPACKDGNNNYDVTVEGATKGTMKFYQGSELYVEWHHQHGCGVGHPNLRCQIVLQYMTDGDNPNMRDGTDQDSAGGDDDDPTEEETAEPARGYHEPYDFYQACIQRERNKGLFTADQQIEENGGATSTRQNPNGNGRRRGGQRHGLECPEERDYYPYWHPTPWHDIAVLTEEPQERCEYYRTESQNVQDKGYCTLPEYNNPTACVANAGEWKVQAAFNEPPPDCTGGISSRDNHNGNVRNGQPHYYMWKIPDFLKGRVVLRIRYNITTKDFDYGSLANPVEEGAQLSGVKADPFFMDSKFNDPNPGNRRRRTFSGRPGVPLPLAQDPVADWLKLGENALDTSRLLQLQVNTNQFGRTFEDRTHTFIVTERPADVPMERRIVNVNVRGRRGNIVQVYPSVEYDFIPSDLSVEVGTLLHFQWTGSDANNNNNAGNGRAGTDRSNLVQGLNIHFWAYGWVAILSIVIIATEQHSLLHEIFRGLMTLSFSSGLVVIGWGISAMASRLAAREDKGRRAGKAADRVLQAALLMFALSDRQREHGIIWNPWNANQQCFKYWILSHGSASCMCSLCDAESPAKTLLMKRIERADGTNRLHAV